MEPTPLVIVGAGAAGLMAACHAGERGIPVLLLERKHRAGSKLLMCGNGRCNLTSDLSAESMLADFGAPHDLFLAAAIQAFSPTALQRWFEGNGLRLMRTRDGKVFPKSERATDVVHCLTDVLRRYGVSICYNAPVDSIQPDGNRFAIASPNFRVYADNVLIATGGVSYPKTGSVGDGQRIAGVLGHKLKPYRPGLVGIAWDDPWLKAHLGEEFKSALVAVFDGKRKIGETSGLLECERWGLGGGAISNATRLLARYGAARPVMEIRYARNAQPVRIDQVKTRPMKEAMVTVGGVDQAEIDPDSMASKRVSGLYFAGEVMDVDGPTGGYNLTAAFATARLAVDAIARAGDYRAPTRKRPKAPARRRPRRRT